MADTQTTDEVATAPEGPAIDAEDPRHLNAAQLRVAQLMRNARDHGEHHFVTGDGIVTFRPFSEDEKAAAAAQLQRWADGSRAPLPLNDLYDENGEHPRVQELHAQAAQIPQVRDLYTRIARSLGGDAEAGKSVEHLDTLTAEPSEAHSAPQFVRDWWKGLGEDMRAKAAAPQSELWRDFAVKALTTAPLAVRASPAAIAAAEARAAPAPKEPGPWDANFDQGTWRDQHPIKQGETASVRAFREKQSQPIEKEPSVSWEKFKKALDTREGYAAAGTVALQPFMPLMKEIFGKESGEAREELRKLTDREAVLLHVKDNDPDRYTKEGMAEQLRNVRVQVRDILKARPWFDLPGMLRKQAPPDKQ